MTESYIVFVRTDDAGRITDVNSSAFLTDTSGWTRIDAGTGDRFHHAQGNYFPLPLTDEAGCASYMLENGAPRPCTQEEKQAQLAARPAPSPTQLDRVEAQAAYTAMMTNTLLEG